MKFTLTLAAALLCSTAFAQTVKLPPKIVGQANAFVAVKAEADGDEVYFTTKSTVLAVFPPNLLKDPKATIVMGPPGTYVLDAVTYKNGFGTPSSTIVELVAIGPNPGPQPNPNPNPTPPDPPAPVAQKLYVVVIAETGDAAVGTAPLFTDPVLNARMKEKGHKFRIVDKDVIGPDGQPPMDIKRFLDDAKTKMYPQVYFVGQDGKTVSQSPLPRSPAEVLDLLKKAGG